MANKTATALRRFSIGGMPVAKGDVLTDMPTSQFDSFEGAGLVRSATDAETKRATDGDAADAPAKPAPAAKPAKQ